jgi:hypothetical protein
MKHGKKKKKKKEKKVNGKNKKKEKKEKLTYLARHFPRGSSLVWGGNCLLLALWVGRELSDRGFRTIVRTGRFLDKMGATTREQSIALI